MSSRIPPVCHRHLALPHTGHKGAKSLCQDIKASTSLNAKDRKLTGPKCPNKVGESLSCSLEGCQLLPGSLAQGEPEWDAARSQPGSDSMKWAPDPAKFLPSSKEFYLPGENSIITQTASSSSGFQDRN